MPELERLPLASLTIDSRLQLREGGTDPALVAEYAEAMREGAQFPPIAAMFDGHRYHIYRGFHRLEAARSLGLDDIGAQVDPGGFDDALIAACGENAEHGQRRKRGDVTKAIKALVPVMATRTDFPEGWNQQRIAAICHCHQSTVSAVLAGLVDEPALANTIAILHNANATAVARRQAAERQRTADAEADRAEQERRRAQADAARQAELDAIREATLAQAREDFNALAAEREAWLHEQINLMRQEARDANAQAIVLRNELTQLQEAERRRAEAVAAEMTDAAELADDLFEKNPELVRARWRAALSQAESMVHRHWLMLNIEAFATVADEAERRRMIDFLAKLRASIDRAEHALGVKVMSQGGRRHGKTNTAN